MDAEGQARSISRPEMLTAAQFSERFRLAPATVDNRRRSGRLLGLRPDGTRKTLRYPAWQGKLIADPGSRQLFERLLQALRSSSDPWRTYEFFLNPSPVLAGKSPLEGWRVEAGEALLQAAHAWSSARSGS